MTRTTVRCVALAIFLLNLADTHGTIQAQASPRTSCCSLVERALKDYKALRVGSKRKDVEQFFTESGGLSFGAQTVFEYKKCHYIKVAITFKYANGISKSEDDTADSISELSIDHEAKD